MVDAGEALRRRELVLMFADSLAAGQPAADARGRFRRAISCVLLQLQWRKGWRVSELFFEERRVLRRRYTALYCRSRVAKLTAAEASEKLSLERYRLTALDIFYFRTLAEAEMAAGRSAAGDSESSGVSHTSSSVEAKRGRALSSRLKVSLPSWRKGRLAQRDALPAHVVPLESLKSLASIPDDDEEGLGGGGGSLAQLRARHPLGHPLGASSGGRSRAADMDARDFDDRSVSFSESELGEVPHLSDEQQKLVAALYTSRGEESLLGDVDDELLETLTATSSISESTATGTGRERSGRTATASGAETSVALRLGSLRVTLVRDGEAELLHALVSDLRISAGFRPMTARASGTLGRLEVRISHLLLRAPTSSCLLLPPPASSRLRPPPPFQSRGGPFVHRVWLPSRPTCLDRTH